MAVVRLDSPNLTLESAGGKGLNLARLAQAGFRVPRGFVIDTDEYRLFVADNRLAAGLRAALFGLSADDVQGIERASQMIRRLFASGRLNAQTEAAIRQAYTSLRDGPVAVRSSATAEDLPDLS